MVVLAQRTQHFAFKIKLSILKNLKLRLKSNESSAIYKACGKFLKIKKAEMILLSTSKNLF
jgi:hypothetical protein